MTLAPLPDELLDSVLDVALAAGQAEAARLERPLCWGCFVGALARRLVVEALPAARADLARPPDHREVESVEVWQAVEAAGEAAAHEALIVEEHGR